uniref:Uncharacterized protein n=1 Tax=Anopheles maculatus TaxID=74869 RepID=A0A182S5R9_9DIPT
MLMKTDYDEGATIEELEALEEVAYANQQELLSKQNKGKKHVSPIVSTGQIVRTSRSAEDTGANTSAGSSGATVVGKSTKPSNSVGGSVIFKKVNGVSIVKKDKSTPSSGDQTKGTRNSDLPEVSSPMSMPERSPYHRTATPSMSGGSSSRSSNSSGTGGGGGGGGGGAESLNYNGGNETIEEIFSESPIPPFRSTGSDVGQRGSPVVGKTGKLDNGDQIRQPKYATRSRNVSERGRAAGGATNVPANLIQLIESTIDAEELENYGEPLEEDFEEDDHGYLVDHVDEIDPKIVQLYNQDADSEMMLNTPMVIKEMEKQQQKQQKQRQQVGGKRGESLLKGNSAADAGRRNEGGQSPSNAPRSQGRSLLSSGSLPAKAGGSGLKASSTAGPEIPSLIMTRGGKKLAMAKKQTVGQSNEQQQQQQQEDSSSPGPSGFNQRDQQPNVSNHSAANTPSPSSVASDGLTFASDSNGYIAATDIVPGDIFEDSNDQNGGIVKNENNPSPMLSSGFNFIDGGYYNPNVNINQMKAGRQQQQQQQQQQVQAPQNNQQQQQQQQQQSSPSVSQMLNGEDAEFDENSLDSSVLLTRASSQPGNNDTTDQQQQLSKFVSNDLDVSRLNTVLVFLFGGKKNPRVLLGRGCCVLLATPFDYYHRINTNTGSLRGHVTLLICFATPSFSPCFLRSRKYFYNIRLLQTQRYVAYIVSPSSC